MNDNEFFAMLEENKVVPERDPRAAAIGRTNFLREASELRAHVSVAAAKRQIGWNIFPRKDGFAMKTLLTMVIAVMMITTGAATVYAAQDDLPNQPLYSIKIWSEDIGLSLTGTPSARVERLMKLAQRRVDEMAGLAAQGVAIPTNVTERLRQHIEEALQLAAGQDNDEMQASLIRIRERLQVQEQVLNQIKAQAPQTTTPGLERAREMMREQIRAAEDGLTNQQQFRNRYQNQNRVSQTATPSPTSVENSTPQPTSTQVGGYGPGPNATPNMGTPKPTGNDDSNPGATPGDGSGSSNGNGTGGGGSGGGNKP